MKERLRKFMKAENQNSTQLAAALGIQSSGISHILSGRNNPSYEFVTKLLTLYPNLNPDWLLLGKGTMYRQDVKPKRSTTSSSEPVLDFSSSAVSTDSLLEQNSSNETREGLLGIDANGSGSGLSSGVSSARVVGDSTQEARPAQFGQGGVACKDVERIVILYRDGSCDTYIPTLKK